jgi:hypothetical protein
LSDENISLDIDDSTIDDILAKLNEALEKTDKLAGKASEATQQPENVAAPTQAESTQPFVMSQEEAAIEEARINAVEAKAAEAKAQVDAVEAKAAEAKAQVDAVEAEATQQLKNDAVQVESTQPFVMSQEEAAIEEARLMELQAKAAEVKTEVDDTVVEVEQKLEDVEAKTSTAKTEAVTMIQEEGDGLNGLNYSMRRITAQLPGIRDAYRLVENMRRIERFGLTSIGGVTSLLFLALSIYQMIQSVLNQQKQQNEEYRNMIMDAENLTTKSEFDKWQQENSRVADAYRNYIIP